MATSIESAEINKIRVKEVAAPSTPASGYGYLYEKSDGKLYFKNDAGTEYDLTDNGTASSSIIPSTFNARLTLTTGVPVTTSDVTAAGTLYLTPFGGNQIALYNGSAWEYHTLSEISLALTLTDATNYDIFVYDNTGTLTLEAVAWTNDTTRATALALQDGVYVKSGAATRRYVGTIRASGTNTTEDSVLKRFVWNAYNRRPRALKVIDTTDSWNYATAAWRSWNNSAANRVQAVIGLDEDVVTLRFFGSARNSGNNPHSLGIGLDSTSTPAGIYSFHSSSVNGVLSAEYAGLPGIGFHYLQLLEYGNATGTTTFFGDGGFAGAQSGASGIVVA